MSEQNEFISGNTKELFQKLREPFDPMLVQWRPEGKPYNGKILAIPYIESRTVFKRLNEVFGPTGWSVSYRIIHTREEPFSVSVEATIRIGRMSKSDIGGAEIGGYCSDIPTTMKAAYSDAVKRAAVPFGIGAYLYALDSFWATADGNRFAKGYEVELAAKLPAWAKPAKKNEAQPDAPKKEGQPVSQAQPKKTNAPVETISYEKAIQYLNKASTDCANETGSDGEALYEAAFEILNNACPEEGQPVPKTVMVKIEEYFRKFLDG